MFIFDFVAETVLDPVSYTHLDVYKRQGYNLPENVLRSITEAEGKYLTADVYAGDYIVAEKVADETAAENKYLYNLNGEKQAISITISSCAEGLSGKLNSCRLYTS